MAARSYPGSFSTFNFTASRAAGCSFSFMGKAGWNLLHRQRALSTMGGVMIRKEGGTL